MNKYDQTDKSFYPVKQEDLIYLSCRDSRLGAAIARIGPLKIELIEDLYTAIVFNIISQQISFKAATTVWERVAAAFSDQRTRYIKPEAVLKADGSKLQETGLSWRKVSFIRSCAEFFSDGLISRDALSELSDQEAAEHLLRLPGIGPWTAEMLLIFSLQRPDIFSWRDLAIRRGLMRLHNLPALNQTEFGFYKRLYSPLGTIASFYMWHLAHEK